MRWISPVVVAAVVLAAAAAFGDTERDADIDIVDIDIVDKPVKFDDERKQLTLQYRRLHQDLDADSIDIVPKMIVLHYTAGRSWKGTWRYFNKTRMEGGRKKLQKAGALNVLAHFIVARDGTIYRLIPETTMGRHTIGLNHVAIGVENVGDGKKYKLTAAQVEADAKLVRYLAKKYSTITHLIGHHESAQMEGTELWLERDPKYRNKKPDPGKAFMRKVRERVEDLGLEGPPPKVRD